MSSSEGNFTDTPGFSKPVLHTTTADREQSLDSKQIFDLLESLLPLEICLHYQVLPLELERQRLVLGMVYPKDDDALEYVNRIISYLNYTIDTRAIAVNTHQEILSAYLRYKNTNTDNCQIQKPEIVEEAQYSSSSAHIEEVHPHNSQQELIQTHDDQQVDSQEKMAAIESIDNEHPTFTPTIEVETEATYLQCSATVLQSSTIDKTREKLTQKLPVLSLPPAEELHPLDVLPTLAPKQLLTELLSRVLTSGIGRLYLKREPYEGQIIWSNNGIPQYVIEKLPLSQYQGVLNELKRFGSFSLTTIDQIQQVEKEYLHQNNSLLIRLRIMPGECGEEATLQVLKGTALKFYRQKQIERLSNDSLRITQTLSHKLHNLQERLLLNSNDNAEKLTALHQLDQLINSLDYQIKILTIPSE
ncbi:pilus assembly protein PilB [Calothrix rhizosoleniae]|uniref:GspE/PulE/PilB domain-containing protein n=1 Tax=Calothrix rhizosoleniae TaxID=888997 RepID=UPI000B49A096|nr:pilus assembly protein PilB [Calothrix rhizosoleniae]